MSFAMAAPIYDVVVHDIGNSNHLLPSNFSRKVVDLKYLLVQEIKSSARAAILRRSRSRYRQNKPRLWSRKLSPQFERLYEESESEGYGTGTEYGTYQVTKSKVLRKSVSSPYRIRKNPFAITNMSEIKGTVISSKPMDDMIRVNSPDDDHERTQSHAYSRNKLNGIQIQVERDTDINENSVPSRNTDHTASQPRHGEENDVYLGIGTEPMRNVVIVERPNAEVEKIANLLKKVPSLPNIHPPPLVPLSCGDKEILIYRKLRGIDQLENKCDTQGLDVGKEHLENIRRYSQLKDTEIVDSPLVPQKSVPLHGSQAPRSRPPIMSPISCGDEEVLIYSPIPKAGDFLHSVDNIPTGYHKARRKHIPMRPSKIDYGKEIHFDSQRDNSNMDMNKEEHRFTGDKDVEILISRHPNDATDNTCPAITRPPPLSPLPVGECEIITYTPYKSPIDIAGNTYSIPDSEEAQANLFQIPPMSFEQGEIRTFRKYHRTESSDSDEVSDRMSSSSSETEQLHQRRVHQNNTTPGNIFKGYSVDSPDDTDGSMSTLDESEITQYILKPEEEAIVHRGENSSQLEYGDIITVPTINESDEFKYNTMRNAIRPGTVKALKTLFIKWQKQKKYIQSNIENVNPDLFEDRRTADDILQANMSTKEIICLSSQESDTESELNYQLNINSDNETRSPTAILNDETIVWKRTAKVGRTQPSDHRDDYDDFDPDGKGSDNVYAPSSASDVSTVSGSGSPTEILSDKFSFIRMSPELESPVLEIKPSLATDFESSATILPEAAWSRLDVILSSATETIIPQLVSFKKLTFDQNNIPAKSPISEVQDGDANWYGNSLVTTPCMSDHVLLPTNCDTSFTDVKYTAVDTMASSPVCAQENISGNVNNTEIRTNNDNTGKSTDNTEMPRSVNEHTIQSEDATRSGQDYISEPAEPLLLTYIIRHANNANISENHVAVDLTNITAEYGGEKVNLVKEKQTSYSLQRENERFKSQVDPDEETNQNICKNDVEEDRRTYQLPVSAASADNTKWTENIANDKNAFVNSPEHEAVNVETDDCEHDVTSNAVNETAGKTINADENRLNIEYDKSDADYNNKSICSSDSESIKERAKPCSSTTDDTDSESNSDTMSNHRVDKKHATSIPVGQTASFTVEEMSLSQSSFSPHVLSGIANRKDSAYGDIVLIEDKQGGLYVVEDVTETTSMGMMSTGEVSNQRAIEYTQATDDRRNDMDFNTLTTVSSMDDFNTDSLYRRVYEGGNMTSGQAYTVTMDDSTLDSREYRETRNDQSPGVRIYDSYESQTVVQNTATPNQMNIINNQQQANSTMALMSDINNQTTQMNLTTTQLPTVIQIPTVDPNAAYNSALLSSLLTTNINMMATPVQPPPPVFIPQPYPVFLEKNTTAAESPTSQRSLGVNTVSSDVSSLSDNILSTQNVTQTEDVVTVFKSQQMDTQINTNERKNLSQERVIEKEPVYRSTIEIHNLNNSVANDITMETEKHRQSTPQFTVVKSRMSPGSNSTPLDQTLNAQETRLHNRSENRDWSSETNQGFTKIYHSGQTEYTKEPKHSQQRDSRIKSTDSNKSQLHVNFNSQPVPLNVNLNDSRDHVSTSDTSQNHQYRIVKATSSPDYDGPSGHQVIYREITEQPQPSVMSRTATEEVRQTTRTVNGIVDHDDRYNVRNYSAADAKAMQNGDFIVRKGRRQRHGSGSSSDSSVSSFSSGEFKRNIKVNVERKNPHVIVDIHIPEKYKGNVVNNYNREEHSEFRQSGGGTSDRMMRDSGHSGAAHSSMYQSSSHTTSGMSSQQRHGTQNSYKDDYNRNRGRRISSSDDEEIRKSQRKVTRTVKESTETSPQYRVVRTTTSSNYDTAKNQTNNDANVFSDHYYVRKENNAYGRRSRSPSPVTDEEVRNKRVKEVYKVTTFHQKPKGHDMNMNQNQSYKSEKRTTMNTSVPTYSNDSQYREGRTTTHSSDYAKQEIPADRDLKVVRGSFLINNQMSRHSDEQDNLNLFDSSFRMSKSNPLYQSDQDIYRKTEEEQEMTQDITYETVSKIAQSKQMEQATSKHGKQTLSELLLARISNIDSKDISQNIDVQHHHEDIYGGINFIHADGSRMEGDNTQNFDAIGENVELQLKDRKAIVEIKVTAERIVPIDYEFNVWRKSSAVVTRHIEIDLGATEQRRKLYDHVMRTAGRQDAIGSNVGGTRYGNQAVLNSKETLRVFSQILNAAEGDSKNDQSSSRQGISNAPAFFY